MLDCDTLHGTLWWSLFFWLEKTKSSRDVITRNSRGTPWVVWNFLRQIFEGFPPPHFLIKHHFHFTIGKSSSMSWFPFPWSLNGTWFSITSIFPKFYLSPPHNLRFFPFQTTAGWCSFVPAPGGVDEESRPGAPGSGSWTSPTHDGLMENGIFTCIWLLFMGFHVGRYRHTSFMDPMGYCR